MLNETLATLNEAAAKFLWLYFIEIELVVGLKVKNSNHERYSKKWSGHSKCGTYGKVWLRETRAPASLGAE